MKSWLVVVILIIIIGSSIYLRFWNLETNPVWYGDECVYLAVAQNLMHGRLQMEALNWTFFSAYLPQPPLFFILSAISLWFIHSGILAIRVIAALSGVGTTILLYFLGKEILDKRVGLWASFLFAIYPIAIVFTRWSFPYALGMFWVTLTLYFCIKHLKTRTSRFLYLSGITTALALLTFYYAFELFIFILAFMLLVRTKRKNIYATVALSLIPLLLLFLMMLFKDSSSVLFDLRTSLSRGSQELAPSHNTWSILVAYKKFILLDAFMFFGVLGLFFIKREYRSYLWLGFFCLSLLPIARQGNVLDIFFYPLLICLPFIFLGLASLIIFISDKYRGGFDQILAKLPTISGLTKRFVYSVPTIIILLLLFPTVTNDVHQVRTVFIAKLNYFANRNINDTITVAEYLNHATKRDELVIAPPCIYQLLHCRYASLFQSVAYTGEGVEFYPAHIPQSRFYYPCSYYWAKYLVIAEIDRIDTLKKPAIQEVWKKIQHDQWPLVYQQGEFEVYLNPLYKD